MMSCTAHEAYSYRPDGMRHTKSSSSDQVLHVWDQGSIAVDLTFSNAPYTTTLYQRGTGLIAREDAGMRQYYLHNGHGDVVQMVDGAGNVTRSYGYDAFGNQAAPTPGDSNPFRYCGEYFDTKSETYYLRARYYNPRTGRFTQEDVAKDGINWYTYCGGNPVGFYDPSGMSFIDSIGDYFSKFGQDAKDFWNSFTAGHDALLDAYLEDKSFYYLVDFFSHGALTSNEARFYEAESAGDYVNWAFSGIPSMFEGAVNPEEPLSFEHWMNSLGTAAVVYGGYKGVQNVRANAVSPYGTPTPDAVWDSWGNYDKITVNGQTYAKVGDTLYSHHAVDRMQPSMGKGVYPVVGDYGRSVSPTFVDYVIDNPVLYYQQGNGNWVYASGSVRVVTNPQGQIVTIMTK